MDPNSLADAYDTAQADLERKYVEALQQLDEYLGFVDEEEVALKEYPVPVEPPSLSSPTLRAPSASLPRQGSPKSPIRPPSSRSGTSMSAYLWGSGKDGRCGTGSEEGLSHPSPIFQEKNQTLNIQKLACGYHHSAAITDSG